MYLTARGLVLRVTPYKDADAILTLLTEKQGKLTVKARGLRRKNSPLVAPCQLLAYGEFTLFENKGMYTVNEAHAIQLFQGLHKNIERLSLGTYFAQVADVISQEDAPDGALLPLILNCLYMLATGDTPQLLIKAVFEMRCACIAGYTPELSCCAQCGNETPNLFDISRGILLCGTCRDGDSGGIRMPLNDSLLAAMRYLCFCHPKKLFSFQVGPDTAELLSQITESYLSTQLERGFSALDFYKSLNGSYYD